MDVAVLRELLEGVASGGVTVNDAMSELRQLPYEDLGFANVDHHRAMRTGRPEVVYCQGKATDHVVEIVARLAERNPVVLATRATEDVYEAVRDRLPHANYHAMARIIEVREAGAPELEHGEDDPYVLVVSAGTADLPVAEEAVVTARAMGSRVETLYDVGVAGIHRLLNRTDILFKANVIVVAAGMDGALPSVVGGLVAAPVVAVPTSVGYGASFGGVAALLTMLNACSSGIAVMNIDNGFAAGVYAHTINSRTAPPVQKGTK
jgi:NCAIR mutase (PurE)-related protein